MWRVALILNALLMAVLGLASAISQIKLRNFFVQYPQAGEELLGEPATLPTISNLALRLHWLYTAVPVLWALLVLGLLVLYRKQDDRVRDIVQIHTSATLLVGLFMLTFFVTAGVMPFISIVVGLSK